MSETNNEKDILLAEDDNDDVVLFEMAMKKLQLSYQLRVASNGDLLFVLLKERMPHLLFLDIHMPCKDGISCILELRKDRAYDALPVVMYTSNTSKKHIEDCFRGGANMYLTKTNTFGELTDKLKKVFAIDWANYMHYPAAGDFVIN